MSDIQFDEPGLDYMRKYAQQKPAQSALTALIIKSGFAKDEKQAAIVMVVIAVVASFIGYAFWPSSAPVDTRTPVEVSEQ